MPAFAKKQQARRSPGKTAELSGDTLATATIGEMLEGQTGMTGLAGSSKRLASELETGIQNMTCVQPPLDLSLNIGQLCMAKFITACLKGNAKDAASCFHTGYAALFNNERFMERDYASPDTWQTLFDKVSFMICA